MKKRIIAVLLAAAAIIGCTGCASFLNSEFESVTPHSESTASSIVDTGVIKVSDYQGLTDAIIEMIKSGITTRSLRFSDYNGDPEEDTVYACMDVSNNTPLGAYAVSYINSTVNKILSDYQAEINIIYKRTLKQINAIFDLNSFLTLNDELEKILLLRGTYLTFETELDGVSQEYISDTLRKLYFDPDINAAFIPDCTVSYYPEAAAARIVEVSFTYPFAHEEMEQMNHEISTAISRLTVSANNDDEAMRLLLLFEAMTNGVERIDAKDAISADNTAYGALVNGRATDLGMAVAFKLLCNRAGYECYTVYGRLKSIDHYWNIVKCGDYYYHCDPFNAEEKGVAACFLRTDAEISREYWWDTDSYKPCEGDLNYYTVSKIYEEQ